MRGRGTVHECVRRRADDGSVTVFAVIAVTILVMAIGVVADLGSRLHRLQYVQDVARQAARAGADAANVPVSQGGTGAAVNPEKARVAAQAYLSSAGVTGTVRSTATTVTVTASADWTPVLLGLAGVGPRPVTGSSTATLVRVVGGTTR